MTTAKAEKMPARHGSEPSLTGRRAECDGGGAIPGTRFAGREEFAGILTGEYVDHGDPPWRWYLLADLTRKPPGYPAESVWCESESLFLIDAQGRTLPGSLPVHRSQKVHRSQNVHRTQKSQLREK